MIILAGLRSHAMITPKELTEQAFALYRRIIDVEGLCGFYFSRAKRLRLLADKANARYIRRLEAWWRIKEDGSS
ncbi:hypothetical protein [Methylobacter tundripaludum]|uniref:hypothetical protein n=1 Tax=Methylobacter tundripaludum TaxID=173365 RepID=UPI000AC0C679|nr:hypothetical protein [Methylobacter tundripaludum]